MLHDASFVVAYAVSALSAATAKLAHCFESLACLSPPWGYYLIASIVASSIVFAGGCAGWSLLLLERIERLRVAVRQSEIALRFRDSLMDAAATPIVVLTGDMPRSFAGGMGLLDVCLAGPDARGFGAAIMRLVDNSEPFEQPVRTIGIRQLVVRGQPIGQHVALFFDEGSDIEDSGKVDEPKPAAPIAEEVPKLQPAELERARSSDNAGARRDPPRKIHIATPNISSEGIILLGADGCLKQFNPAFAKMWALDVSTLPDNPHLSLIAARCMAQFGQDGIWDIVAAAASSHEPERHGGWGAIRRADGLCLSLAMSRLADGGTEVIFAIDLTHADRSARLAVAA